VVKNERKETRKSRTRQIKNVFLSRLQDVLSHFKPTQTITETLSAITSNDLYLNPAFYFFYSMPLKK
jgi:hypothetical protein